MSVICRPEGPSRWVSSWHGKLSTFVADDEATLRHWLQNRYDGAVSNKIGPQPIPLLWLPRPLQPSEYPRTVGELLSVLEEIKIGRDMVEQLLLDEKAEYKSVMLGFTGRRGSSFAGLRRIESPKRFGSGRALSKGFRGRPPPHILLTRYRGFPVVGARVFRFDGPWVHGRDHNPHEHTLATKSVIVLGVGSVGGSVAELLAKSGVGTLILVDHDLLASENLGRHALGAQSVGDSKARALAKSLSARFPHLTFKHSTQSSEGFANAMPDCHRRSSHLDNGLLASRKYVKRTSEPN